MFLAGSSTLATSAAASGGHAVSARTATRESVSSRQTRRMVNVRVIAESQNTNRWYATISLYTYSCTTDSHFV
jgi:hypothetical protein